MSRQVRCVSLHSKLHRRLTQSTRRRRLPRHEPLPDAAGARLDALCLDGCVLVEELVTHVAVVPTFSGTETVVSA